MSRKIKLPLVISIIILAIYSAFWLKVSSDIADSLNQKMAAKISNITKTHRIQFSKATISGFPFGFGVKLHDFTEDIDRATVYHQSPILVAYNIFTKELYMDYSGESLIKLKPLGDKKVRKSIGAFRHSAHIPLSLSDLRNMITDPKKIAILSNIQNLKFTVKNANLTDTSNDTLLVRNTNTDVMLMIRHHRIYKTLEEFFTDIPNNYDVSLNIDNQCYDTSQDSIGWSLIYGLYIPFNLNYNLKTTLHTGAKTFSLTDILSDFSIKNWESSIATELEESQSKLELETSIAKKNIKFDINTLTQMKIKASYSKKISELLKSADKIIPPVIPSVKSTIRQLDFSTLNLDTKNDPVSIAFKLHMDVDDKLQNVAIDVGSFGVKFHDIAFDLKNITKGGINKGWNSYGVVSVEQYDTLIKYLVDTYFALHHLPINDKFNTDFYHKMLSDFIYKISNNINNIHNNAIIEYELNHDITTSKLGKFTWPETTLIYYATLLKHIRGISSNEEEALSQFKVLVPEYVVTPEVLEKITPQSKE